jgi:hypothetical protein
MKYATKMQLIPIGRDTPAESTLNELDEQLHSILARNDLSNVDKLKHYNQVLSRYLNIQQNVLQQSVQNENKIDNSLKRKISELLINESKKLKKSNSDNDYYENNEADSNAIDDDDYYEDYEHSINEFESVNDVSEGSVKKLNIDEMEAMNDRLMKKSASFDHTRINDKDENKLLQTKIRQNKFKNLLNWSPYKF